MSVANSDQRFACLPDFAFAPLSRGSQPGGPPLRIHYLDKAAALKPGAVLHGEPTWSTSTGT